MTTLNNGNSFYIRTSTSLCPIVCVGMYDSILSVNYQLEDFIEYSEILEDLKERAFSESIIDIEGWKKYITEFTRDYITDNVLEDLPFNATIGRTTYLISPREYNFTTDYMEMDIKVPSNIQELIKKELATNMAMFHDYYKEEYGSRPGFISFAPDFHELWQDNPSEKALTYLVSAYIAYYTETFINGDLQDDFNLTFLDHCGSSLGFEEFITFPEDLEKLIYPED